MQWFDVDKQGLRKLVERKGPAFILFELVQNAWDENATTVHIGLERIAGTRNARLVVEDDNPDGFDNLTHAFTLFAESTKKGDPSKRGRFNLGEKLALALCREATISSTKGSVVFNASGRHVSRARRDRGSQFAGIIPLSGKDLQACHAAARLLLPPAGINTYYNAELIPTREPAASVGATLLTHMTDEEGVLRTTQRKTLIDIIEPRPGETPMLFEMGIPVVETGDRWHLNIQQKVPVSFDRDNVPPAYLAKVRALAVEAMRNALTTEDANAPWVRDAMQKHGEALSDTTVRHLTALRFGKKAVAFDPSDLEANHRATAAGYTVVHGRLLSKAEWDVTKRAGALPAAGQVTPSPKPFSDQGAPLRLLDRDQWPDSIRRVVAYIDRVAPQLLGSAVTTRIANDPGWPFEAAYGTGELTINLARVGPAWFTGPLSSINALLIHEFGHHYCGNHLADDYHDALCRLGGALSHLAVKDPVLFDLTRD